MNTKTLKGILLYSLIIIGVVLAIFLIGIILMFIFPNLKIFGYGMISHKKTIENNLSIVSNDSTPYNIAINVDNFNLYVDSTDSSEISYKIFDNCLGASNVFNTSIITKKNNNSSSLTLIEPQGLLTYKNSSLTINLPKSKTYDLTLKSKNGNISISNTLINNFNITTTHGNFTIKNKNENSLNLNSLFISTDSGNFDFSSNYESVKINNGLIINSNKGNFIFKDLISDVKINSKDVYFEAKNITTSKGFEANVNNIILKISSTLNSESSQNSILTSSIMLEINDIKGITSVKSSNGKIKFATIYNSCIINSGNGDVDIKNAKEYLKVVSTNGNISVGTYEQTGFFKTTTGNISCVSTSNNALSNKTTIQTNSGNITHTTNLIPFSINSNEDSNIKVTLNDIYYAENLETSKMYEILSKESNLIVNITSKKYFKCSCEGKINSSNGDIKITNSKEPLVYPVGSTPTIAKELLPYLKINAKTISFNTIMV